ncbi:hypothetical protein PREVCOP_04396 [Segatella copri DSM 18205]|uniref:Uncharacterized protein n=1 Tax=Segatella copri DSM 18205 TaxID=537011 RepID=D1PB20_9BACT|nr:hypothetical protein PREVCOP_04396 [Segatella copri DSM 18205]
MLCFKEFIKSQFPRCFFLSFSESSLMTGACHLLLPVSVFIDDRL